MFLLSIPVIIIFLSLAGIAIIIVRKFPQLSALQVEKIETVKQAKIKESIKFQRFNRAWGDFWRKIGKGLGFFKTARKHWEELQSVFRNKVRQTQEKYKRIIFEEVKKQKKKILAPEAKKEINALLSQADEAFNRGDLTFAERKFIDVIKLDPRHKEAYRGLGKVYVDMEKYAEAEETFKFLIKLSPRDDRAYNRLGMIADLRGDLDKAAVYFEKAVQLNDSLAIRFYDLGRIYAKENRPALALQNFIKAVKIEPNNPKYLDQVLEMSIISKDKELARDILERLKSVNSENQKIEEFERRMEEIE